jgi:hypothetical protein
MRLLFSITLSSLCTLSLLVSTCKADLVAGWDFQTTTNGGTAVLAAPATPKLYTANFGAGTLYLNGSEGSSDWFVPATGTANTQLNGFGGTAVNAGVGFSTTTSSPAALAFISNAANDKFAVFKFSMAGFKDLVVSYATQKTSTGFTTQTWSFSTNGTSWTDAQIVGGASIPTSFAAVTLNNISGLDDAANAYLRVQFSGATSTSGNNRLDNIQFNASSAVPEPATLSLLGVAIGLGAVSRFRRK